MAQHQRTSLAILSLAVIAAGALSGCGGSSETEAPPEPPPVEDTAFGDMVGTMDKARGVQDTVDTHKQDVDQQIQSAEGQSEQ